MEFGRKTRSACGHHFSGKRKKLPFKTFFFKKWNKWNLIMEPDPAELERQHLADLLKYDQY